MDPSPTLTAPAHPLPDADTASSTRRCCLLDGSGASCGRGETAAWPRASDPPLQWRRRARTAEGGWHTTLCHVGLRCQIPAPMGGIQGRPATLPYGGRKAREAGE
jgi:hypothetical protein